jgi:predicted nucleic acid-binding protein
VIVLDANILIRAVLGSRVLIPIRKYADTAEFVAPDAVFEEAREELPPVLERRKIRFAPAMVVLDSLRPLVKTVALERYALFEQGARQRLIRRDEDDWPILATAMAMGCTIWTEDTDFFGCGVATWTTDRLEVYLAESDFETTFE